MSWYPLSKSAGPDGEDHPIPGLYRMRIVKGGVWVACAIFVPCPAVPVLDEIDPVDWLCPLDRSRRLTALVNGWQRFNPQDVWGGCLKGGPITPGEYRYLVDHRRWANEHAPDSPEADPWKPADITKQDPIF